MSPWLARLRARVKYRRFDSDLAEELDTHRAMKETDLVAAGLDRDDARWQAARELGNSTMAREDARAVWIAPWVESIWQDVRYAVRHLRSHPAFTVTASATLVLGIGLNVALFTVYNAAALREWPVRDPATFAQVRPDRDGQGRAVPISGNEYRFLRERTTSFTGLASLLRAGVFLGDDATELTATVFAPDNFFEVLGVDIRAGRGLLAEESVAGVPRAVVVISHRLWLARFNADPGIVGRSIRLNRVPFTVVGVAGPRFTGLHARLPLDLIVPAPAAALLGRATDDAIGGEVVGRLARGVTRAAAKVELDALSRRFRTSLGLGPRGLVVTGTAAIQQPDAARQFAPLQLILGAVFTVLLVACSNVGALQLARALGREREIRTRLAVGAGRARLVRQLMTEALVLAGGAGAAAVGIAFILPAPAIRFITGDVLHDPFQTFRPDTTVLVFTLTCSTIAALASGLAPALYATRPMLAGRRAGFSIRQLLLATQIAFTTVLLVAASLLTRGVSVALSADHGFQTQDVLVAEIQPGKAQDRTGAPVLLGALVAELVSNGIPAGLAGIPPLKYSSIAMRVQLPGESEAGYRLAPDRPVSNGYFSVLNIPLVDGRWFNERAAEGREAIVNEAFARTFWAGEKAVGKTFIDGRRRVVYTVVGVVRNCREAGLDSIPPVLHTLVDLGSRPTLVIRGSRPETEARLRSLVRQTDAHANVIVAPLSDTLREALKYSILGARVAWAIGVLGLVLAMVGVFGVFSYVVAARRREIGVRLALGASRTHVVRLILRQTRRAFVGGLGVGFVLSLAVGRLLGSYLHGLSPIDPVAYSVTGLALLGSAVAASFVPARRAGSIDPAITLRCE